MILQVIQNAHNHPTADEVYERVRKEMPNVSLGTVYRNLDILEKDGRIKMLSRGPQRRYDGAPDTHYHLRCTMCGKVEDAPVEHLRDINGQVQAASDYKITGHTLEFEGVCPDCQRKIEN